MANQIVNRQVNVYINSGEAQKAYDILIKREKALNEELKKTSDPKRIKQLNAELAKLAEPIDRATKKLKGEMAPSIRDLELATRKFLTEFKKTGDPETLANFRKFQAQLNEARGQLTNLDNAQQGLTKRGIFSAAFWANLAAGAATAVAGSVIQFFTDSVDEALAAEKATAQLQNTLDNLGQGDSFDRITRKADEMAQQFRFLDNDDVIGVFNKLIDYGKLTEQEMNDLLPVIINFAAKSRISLEESTSVIVKALEGNGKALKEYGIDIKDAGTETERLNVVMTTLKEKVDGAAEAFGGTAAGSIATARQEFNDLKESIGTGILPILNALLSVLNRIVQAANAAVNSVRGFLSGQTSLAGGFTLDALQNNQNVQNEANRVKSAQLFGLDSFLKILEQQQKQGKNLDKTPADIKADYVKTLQARLQDINNIISEEVKKAFPDRQKLMDKLADQIGIQSAIDQLTTGQNQLGIGDRDKSDTAKTTKTKPQRARLNFVTRQALLTPEEMSEAEKEMLAQIKRLSELASTAGTKENIARFEENQKAIVALLSNDAIAKQDLAILEARGKEKLALQKEQLRQQEQEEINALIREAGRRGVTEEQIQNSIALIRKRYRDKEEKIETESLQQRIQNVLNFANQALAVFTQIGQVQTDRENAELERDKQLNDRKIKNLDNRLRKGLISQLEYDREVEKIEKEREKKEKEVRIKQFRRQQRERLIQAVINTAEAVTEALPNLVLAAIAGAAGAAQIAVIAAQKPPEFARGGKLGGRSHASGGNAVVDGSGRKIAEVEAGEGIVNKRTMADRGHYTVSGTPGQIVSRINSLHGVGWESGATLVPGWRTISPRSMNFTAMKKMYATGGVFNTPKSVAEEAAENPIFENLAAVLSDMQTTLASIQANGIAAYTVLTQQEKQQIRLDAIRNEATMK